MKKLTPRQAIEEGLQVGDKFIGRIGKTPMEVTKILSSCVFLGKTVGASLPPFKISAGRELEFLLQEPLEFQTIGGKEV